MTPTPRSPRRSRRIGAALRGFVTGEAAGGVVLVAAAALALVAANLDATADAYAHWLHVTIGPMTLHSWINDALMALFFLLVGLEVKRELVDGELASAARRKLPFVAAACGMAVPALVYLAFAGRDPQLRAGWAIPAATDIAFAMGVMALLGRRVPPPLKLLLATVAIVDDMGSVAIIALAYTDAIRFVPLAAAAGMLALLRLLNRRGVTALWPFLLGGAMLWWLVLRSGVHATIAGVLLAAVIPIRCPPGGADDAARSPLHRLEHALHPWSAYVIVPLFAFANAGVALRGPAWQALAEPLVPAIAAGLFLGKQAGILGGIWAATRAGIAARPHGVTWRQLYGLALLAGIGFTMSLFVGGLAFPGDARLMQQVKVGVLAGSLLSAILGSIVLATAPPARDHAA